MKRKETCVNIYDRNRKQRGKREAGYYEKWTYKYGRNEVGEC
jgi:hypothetical protein